MSDRGRGHPLLARRGGRDQRKYRAASLVERTGWWFNFHKRILCLCLIRHPASLGGCCAAFLEFARSAPPGQEGPGAPAASLGTYFTAKAYSSFRLLINSVPWAG